MKKFFLALYAQLQTVSGLTPDTIRLWNNQAALIDQGHLQLYFDTMSVCIEFNSSVIHQLGEGRQLFDPLIFKLHILHKQRDAGDGTFEQNLDVYDFKDAVYKAIQKFQPGISDSTTPVGSCIRIAEDQDYNHNALYHYVQTYRTTFVDEIATEPVNGQDGPIPPLPLELDEVKAINVDNATSYDSTIQYLAVNNAIIFYEDPTTLKTYYYQIKLDTPSPAGTFDPTKWTLLTNVYNFTPP